MVNYLREVIFILMGCFMMVIKKIIILINLQQ